jgi:hypothetical protein
LAFELPNAKVVLNVSVPNVAGRVAVEGNEESKVPHES